MVRISPRVRLQLLLVTTVPAGALVALAAAGSRVPILPRRDIAWPASEAGAVA